MEDTRATVTQAQSDIRALQKEVENHHRFITGNGDPQKGLLWLAADAIKMNALIANLIATQTVALEDHKKEGHYSRSSPAKRLAWRAAEQVVTALVTATLLLLLLGVRFWVNSGGATP